MATYDSIWYNMIHIYPRNHNNDTGVRLRRRGAPHGLGPKNINNKHNKLTHVINQMMTVTLRNHTNSMQYFRYPCITLLCSMYCYSIQEIRMATTSSP